MKTNELVIAQFKLGVIGSLRGTDDKSLKSKIKELSEKSWGFPNMTFGKLSAGSIEKWHYAYKNGGIDALTPKIRKDKGLDREIPECVKEKIDELLNKCKDLKTSNIIRFLEQDFEKEMPSKSTIYRYVKVKRPMYTDETKGQERLAFEAPYAGNLWQTDIMYGPYIYCYVDGRLKKCQTYLIAIIDDNSRVIVHGEFFHSQRVEDYASTLKSAILKRGIPETLYCDNGKVFLSSQIKRIATKLGIIIRHTKVRDAAAKGKIERFFRTVRDKFLQPLRITDLPNNIDEFNSQFFAWLEIDYHNKIHSGIKMEPIQKWLRTSQKIRLIPSNKEYTSFLFYAERKVKKDGTISLNGKTYETCFTLAKKKVVVEYDAINDLGVYISYEGTDYGKATLLDKHINNNLPRKNKGVNHG
jgi:transposase InsO family protein